MPKKNAKSKRQDAEIAAQWYVHEVLGAKFTIRAIKNKWQAQDMYGCDVIGRDKWANDFFVQVTAGQIAKVNARRKKLSTYPWKAGDTVEVLQLVQTRDPANPRKKLWFFRVWSLDTVNLFWIAEKDAIPVPKQWFKAYKNRQKGE